jgi:signal transduction histidine kinase
MKLEGIPRAVLIVVTSWAVTLAVWLGSMVGVVVLVPRTSTLRWALMVAAVMALVANSVGFVISRRAVERHVPPGQGQTVLLVITAGMAAFLALVEATTSLLALSR